MAYIRKLPSGKFQATVRLPNGRRKTFTDPLKRVVAARAAEIESAITHGDALPLRDRKLTVAGWESKWSRARHVEPVTAAKNASMMRVHVLPRWGDWPLHAVGRLDVQTWVNDMHRAGVGANTIAGSYRLLSRMFADAVLEGLVASSPCREVDLPRVQKPAERWLTREEYDRIQLALAVIPRASTWQAFVALGCFSGLRPGELAGLDVEHVDFGRRLVHVQQVVTRAGLRPYPKSASSDRWVPFPAHVGELLWALVGDRGQGPVFTAAKGGRVNESNLRNRVWAPAVAAAGVAPCPPYVMRHSAASWLAQAGVSSDEIARMLGHSSTRIVSTYAHHDPGRYREVLDVWADARDAQVTHAG